jgi:hypothetical protein
VVKIVDSGARSAEFLVFRGRSALHLVDLRFVKRMSFPILNIFFFLNTSRLSFLSQNWLSFILLQIVQLDLPDILRVHGFLRCGLVVLYWFSLG